MPRTKTVKKPEGELLLEEVAKPGAPKKRARARGSSAVMQQRTECPDSLDFFPTPPWATRAFCEIVLPILGFTPGELDGMVAGEPAAGEDHLAGPLREYFRDVLCSDVHDYGKGHRIASYVGGGMDVLPPYEGDTAVDWVITNPPFNEAVRFARRALDEARVGVALLVRLAWIESEERWRLFSEFPPTAIATYVERVPMVKGVWDPNASSATAYCWVIWVKPLSVRARASGFPSAVDARIIWIPPGQKERFTTDEDLRKYAKIEPLPLFDGLPPLTAPAEAVSEPPALVAAE